MKVKVLFLIFICFICGCASSTKVSQSLPEGEAKSEKYGQFEIANAGTEAPDHFVSAVKSYLKQELVSSGHFDESSSSKVSINIKTYRMRSGFSRAMFGAFAGKDGVSSNVVVIDEDGNEIGKSDVSSFNIMAIGGMEDIARMHAKEIAKFLTGKKSKS